MARNQTFRRPRRPERWSATTNLEESAIHAADRNSSQKKVEMLPRSLLRWGVSCFVVAIMVLLLMQQREQTLTPFTESSHNEPQAKETASRRTADRPTVQVLGKYPHDAMAFTQGFTVLNVGQDTFFLESTGLYGESTLRCVEIETGKVLEHYELSKKYFGEGMTPGPNNEVVMLTWKSKTGLVFDLNVHRNDKSDRFALQREFKFKTATGEGWGITFNGKEYVVSDGSSIISFWDPTTMEEIRHIDVKISDGRQKISYINELEFAKGFIYANVWYQPHILKIDPDTGVVVTVFDLSDLIDEARVNVASGAVLNGIGYDKVEDVFYITGKLWNVVYKVDLNDYAL